MTIHILKSSKLIVVIASGGFLLGTLFGNQAYSFVKSHIVDSVYAKNNNNKNDNNRHRTTNSHKTDNTHRTVNRHETKMNVDKDIKVVRHENDKKVIVKQPVVIHTVGETVVERTIENNNVNNNENNNNVEVNPVIENKVVYETKGGYTVYEAPKIVQKTPETGSGLLSFLALLPGGAVALFRKRFFV